MGSGFDMADAALVTGTGPGVAKCRSSDYSPPMQLLPCHVGLLSPSLLTNVWHSPNKGSAIHVMLVKRVRATVGQNHFQYGGDQQQGMVIRSVCPQCGSLKYKRNGHVHNGKQNHQCKACGRQFVECFEQYLISDNTRALIARMLQEWISLRGICRTVRVGLKWLWGFVVQCFETLPSICRSNLSR